MKQCAVQTAPDSGVSLSHGETNIYQLTQISCIPWQRKHAGCFAELVVMTHKKTFPN